MTRLIWKFTFAFFLVSYVFGSSSFEEVDRVYRPKLAEQYQWDRSSGQHIRIFIDESAMSRPISPQLFYNQPPSLQPSSIPSLQSRSTYYPPPTAWGPFYTNSPPLFPHQLYPNPFFRPSPVSHPFPGYAGTTWLAQPETSFLSTPSFSRIPPELAPLPPTRTFNNDKLIDIHPSAKSVPSWISVSKPFYVPLKREHPVMDYEIEWAERRWRLSIGLYEEVLVTLTMVGNEKEMRRRSKDRTRRLAVRRVGLEFAAIKVNQGSLPLSLTMVPAQQLKLLSTLNPQSSIRRQVTKSLFLEGEFVGPSSTHAIHCENSNLIYSNDPQMPLTYLSMRLYTFFNPRGEEDEKKRQEQKSSTSSTSVPVDISHESIGQMSSIVPLPRLSRCGLTNSNKTNCYQSVVFQALYNLGGVKELIIAGIEDKQAAVARQVQRPFQDAPIPHFPNQLNNCYEILKLLGKSSSVPVPLGQFYRPPAQQGDAHDFWRQYVEVITKQLKTIDPTRGIQLEQIFLGENVEQRQYLSTLSAPVVPSPYFKKVSFGEIVIRPSEHGSVTDGIKALYTQDQYRDGVDDSFGVKRMMRIQTRLSKAPQILLVVIGRFNQVSRLIDGDVKQVPVKDNRRVTFDEHLNLTPYFHDQKQKDDLRYTLKAVVAHHGQGLAGGHYWLYVRNEEAKSNNWVKYDDTNVYTGINKYEATQAMYGGIQQQEGFFIPNAYLLFYQKNIDEKSSDSKVTLKQETKVGEFKETKEFNRQVPDDIDNKTIEDLFNLIQMSPKGNSEHSAPSQQPSQLNDEPEVEIQEVGEEDEEEIDTSIIDDEKHVMEVKMEDPSQDVFKSHGMYPSPESSPTGIRQRFDLETKRLPPNIPLNSSTELEIDVEEESSGDQKESKLSADRTFIRSQLIRVYVAKLSSVLFPIPMPDKENEHKDFGKNRVNVPGTPFDTFQLPFNFAFSEVEKETKSVFWALRKDPNANTVILGHRVLAGETIADHVNMHGNLLLQVDSTLVNPQPSSQLEVTSSLNTQLEQVVSPLVCATVKRFNGRDLQIESNLIGSKEQRLSALQMFGKDTLVYLMDHQHMTLAPFLDGPLSALISSDGIRRELILVDRKVNDGFKIWIDAHLGSYSAKAKRRNRSIVSFVNVQSQQQTNLLILNKTDKTFQVFNRLAIVLGLSSGHYIRMIKPTHRKPGISWKGTDPFWHGYQLMYGADPTIVPYTISDPNKK